MYIYIKNCIYFCLDFFLSIHCLLSCLIKTLSCLIADIHIIYSFSFKLKCTQTKLIMQKQLKTNKISHLLWHFCFHNKISHNDEI